MMSNKCWIMWAWAATKVPNGSTGDSRAMRWRESREESEPERSTGRVLARHLDPKAQPDSEDQ